MQSHGQNQQGHESSIRPGIEGMRLSIMFVVDAKSSLALAPRFAACNTASQNQSCVHSRLHAMTARTNRQLIPAPEQNRRLQVEIVGMSSAFSLLLHVFARMALPAQFRQVTINLPGNGKG